MREIMLIIHILSVVVFVGAAFSGFIVNWVSNKYESKTSLKIKTALLSLNYLGKSGLTLLIITGGYLMTPYWAALTSMPLLVTKFSFVTALLILLVFISIKAKKAKKEQSLASFKALDKLQYLNLIISIAVVIMAILIFG